MSGCISPGRAADLQVLKEPVSGGSIPTQCSSDTEGGFLVFIECCGRDFEHVEQSSLAGSSSLSNSISASFSLSPWSPFTGGWVGRGGWCRGSPGVAGGLWHWGHMLGDEEQLLSLATTNKCFTATKLWASGWLSPWNVLILGKEDVPINPGTTSGSIREYLEIVAQ